MVIRWAAVVAFVFALAFSVTSAANASEHHPACPPDPGPIPESITNDAAIQVREGRRENAEACAAIASRLDAAETLATDTRRLGGWLVGVLLLVGVAPILFRIGRGGG